MKYTFGYKYFCNSNKLYIPLTIMESIKKIIYRNNNLTPKKTYNIYEHKLVLIFNLTTLDLTIFT